MVSVIILTYNRYNLLSKTLKSVLGQTYKDLEVLIINDGSNDDTAQITKIFDDKRLRLFNLEKQNNLAKLRNIGVLNAMGEYIAFCDDDDLWVSNKLEIQFEYLKRYDFVCTNAKLINIDDEVVDEKYIKKSKSFIIKTELLIQDNMVLPSSVIFKKQILNTNAPFDEINFINLCEDYNLWIKLSMKNELFFLNEQTISHRTHNSWARSFDHTKEIFNNHVRLIKPFTKSKDKCLKNTAFLSILNTKFYSLKYFISNKKYIIFTKEFFKFIFIFKNPFYMKSLYEKIKNQVLRK